jgi:glycine cleavage system regulatory protein
MKEGEVFPPVIVFYDGSEYWLSDGFHRYFAHKLNGFSSIDCDVHEGTLDDATLFSFTTNGKHGLGWTAEDKRNIIIKMLRHPIWSQWTNAEIARQANISKMTVGRVKKSLEADSVKTDEPEIKKFITKKGLIAEVNVTNLKTKTKAEPVKPTVQEDFEEDAINDLSETIEEMNKEITLLKDTIALGQWDASEIEKIDVQDTITELREKIRVLEIDNAALRVSRDTFQSKNADLMRINKSLQNKLAKYEK